MLVDFDQPFHALPDFAAFHMQFKPSPNTRYFIQGSSCLKINSNEFMVTGGISKVSDLHFTKCVTIISPNKIQGAAPLLTERAYHVSAMLKNRDIFVCGGVNLSDEEAEGSCEIFSVEKKEWVKAGEMLSKRCFGHAACVLPEGLVLISGGVNFKEKTLSALKTTEYFDPATKQFTQGPSLPFAVHHHAMTLLANGIGILLTGGGNETEVATKHATYLNIKTGASKKLANLHTPRAGHIAALIDQGCVIVMGGYGRFHQRLTSAEIYIPIKNKWIFHHEGVCPELFQHMAEM